MEGWYDQVGQSLAAGIDLPSALEGCAGPPAKDRERLAQRLRGGESVDAVLEAAPRWLSLSDRMILSAGAASGKLAEACSALAQEHADLAENRRSLVLAALYPLFILQGSLFMLPAAWAVEMTDGGSPRFDSATYMERFGLLMLGVWGSLVVGLILAGRFPRAAERVLRFMPGVRGYWRHRTLARFAATFDALLEAGVRYADALGGAALAVNDTQLTPRVLDQLSTIQAGQPFGAVLDRIRVIPSSFGQRFRTAEQTGQLHRTLPQLAEEHRKAAKRALLHVSFWYPKLLFLAAALMVGLTVASLYSEYLNFVLEMAE